MLGCSVKTMVVYAGGGLVVLGALVGVGHSMLAPSGAKPCGDRYANSTLFRLERDGALLTVEEIQSRVAHNRTIGLSENAEIMKPRDARIPAAMQISLRSGPAAPGRSVQTSAGIAFPWEPRSVQNEAASCLSYNVFFYADLEFQNGGTLPGVQGSDHSQASRDGFAGHLVWDEDGHPGAWLSVSNNGETGITSLEAKGLTLPRGQWIRIDEEVILNTPGQNNGVLRIWIDRALAIERKDVSYRSRAEVAIAGAAVDVFYGAPDTMAWAPSETSIWVSPLELSWH